MSLSATEVEAEVDAEEEAEAEAEAEAVLSRPTTFLASTETTAQWTVAA